MGEITEFLQNNGRIAVRLHGETSSKAFRSSNLLPYVRSRGGICMTCKETLNLHVFPPCSCHFSARNDAMEQPCTGEDMEAPCDKQDYHNSKVAANPCSRIRSNEDTDLEVLLPTPTNVGWNETIPPASAANVVW